MTSLSPLSLGLMAALLGAGCATTQPRATPAIAEARAFDVEVPAIERPGGETPAWWYRAGAAQAAERGAMAGRARNVILFVGDGMSLATVAAARILEGQRQGRPGEEQQLAWETFPATALSRTYNTDAQAPDSAGTMTAMATGVKTRAGVIGIGQQAARHDCAAALAAPLATLWELAATHGLATGVVTTTRVTHATPAATFTHSADRGWEDDSDLPAGAKAAGCVDIARQLVESPTGGPDVLLGGGRGSFMPATQDDPEYADKVGRRLDGRDLIADWKRRNPGGTYAWNLRQLQQAPAQGRLLGLFEPGHMQYEHDRPADRAGEPTLADMTRAAITRLQHDADGYVLLVEGGRIDHAHHEGNAYRALADTIALSDAVRAATQMTSADDTLILVTADHAHTLTFAGYPVRGNPILGKVRGLALGADGKATVDYSLDSLGLPYTTLGYANGPGYAGASDQQPEGAKRHPHYASGYQPAAGRPDLAEVDTLHPDYLQEATVPASAESHGGDDVGVWARGPGSAAVRGSIEQNAIHHLMLQSLPALRAKLCAAGRCDANGVPVKLPEPLPRVAP